MRAPQILLTHPRPSRRPHGITSRPTAKFSWLAAVRYDPQAEDTPAAPHDSRSAHSKSISEAPPAVRIVTVSRTRVACRGTCRDTAPAARCCCAPPHTPSPHRCTPAPRRIAHCWLRSMSISVRAFSPWFLSKMRSGYSRSAPASGAHMVVERRVVRVPQPNVGSVDPSATASLWFVFAARSTGSPRADRAAHPRRLMKIVQRLQLGGEIERPIHIELVTGVRSSSICSSWIFCVRRFTVAASIPPRTAPAATQSGPGPPAPGRRP